MALGRNLVESFFDGFGPGGLFARAKRPGGATQAFAIRPTGAGEGNHGQAVAMGKRSDGTKEAAANALIHPVLTRASKG